MITAAAATTTSARLAYQSASGTVLVSRASGTVLVSRASGTMLVSRASGTMLPGAPGLPASATRGPSRKVLGDVLGGHRLLFGAFEVADGHDARLALGRAVDQAPARAYVGGPS